MGEAKRRGRSEKRATKTKGSESASSIPWAVHVTPDRVSGHAQPFGNLAQGDMIAKVPASDANMSWVSPLENGFSPGRHLGAELVPSETTLPDTRHRELRCGCPSA